MNGVQKPDIIVIGAGPAGLMAAGRAAELGARVLLLEKNARPGLKLLITGGGRCNVTNSANLREFIAAFGKNGNFLYRALDEFSNTDLMAFLTVRGVPLRTDPDGKVFPADDRADSVLRALLDYAAKTGAELKLKSAATDIIVKDGIATGVTTADGKTIPAKAVIIATGGLSYPKTGSTGDGYRFAKKCGHTIVPLSPGLTALESDEVFIKDLQGLTLRNIPMSVIADGKPLTQGQGDLLFTHFGVSGPELLRLSAYAVDALIAGKTVYLSFAPGTAVTANQAEAELKTYFSDNGAKPFSRCIKDRMTKTLADVFFARCGIPPETHCARISAKDRAKAAALLAGFTIHITRPRPIEEATITRGGAALTEIEPRTMQSKLVKGLYFCGETVDLDGLTGGYNLQEAFSTGRLAGGSAAQA